MEKDFNLKEMLYKCQTDKTVLYDAHLSNCNLFNLCSKFNKKKVCKHGGGKYGGSKYIYTATTY